MERRIGSSRRFGWRACVSAIAISTIAPVVTAADQPTTATVYKSNFEELIRPKLWSQTKTSRTLKGDHIYLGGFGQDGKVTFKLPDVPEHEFIRVKCKLFVIRSHDGNATEWGPDTMSIGLGGVWLTHTNFNNDHVLDAPQNRQSFPDEFPGGSYLPGTGASEKGTLGHVSKQEGASDQGMDAVYDLDMIIPHRRSEVIVEFRSGLREQLWDESYGIAGLEIQTVSGPEPLTEAELSKAWDDFMGKDPVAAFKARWKLVSAGKPGIKFAFEQLKNRKEAQHKRALKEAESMRPMFEKRLAELESEELRTRQSAERKLFNLGVYVLPLIDEKLQGQPSRQVRTYLSRLAARIRKLEDSDNSSANEVLDTRLYRYFAVASEISDEAKTAWKNHLAVTNSAPDGSGRLQLTAANTVFEGEGFAPRVKTRRGLLENWVDETKYFTWHLKNVKPGRYHVSLVAGCHDSQKGSKFEVRLGDDQTLEGTVADTGGWKNPKPHDVGVLKIRGGEEPEVLQLVIISKTVDAVMNFSEIILTPK